VLFKRRSLGVGVVVQQVDEAGGPGGVDVEEQGQVNHHGQREQQSLHGQAGPDEHDHAQHGQQAAVQVVLGVGGNNNNNNNKNNDQHA